MIASQRRLVPAVSVEQLMARADAVRIDLRAPCEFAEDALPGAANVPLFDDAERALIGTLYAQHSPETAYAQARAILRGHVRALVERIAHLADWDVPPLDLEQRFLERSERGMALLESELVPRRLEVLPERAVVLNCWRGGMRSRSMVAFLRELGLERALALEGGYKAYRQWVDARLARWQAPRTYVLRGLTGVGKTLVLRELARLRPGWVVDLEELAAHRSSILGAVGLQPRSQKAFESRLWQSLERGFAGGPLVLEGESRKIGDVVLRENLWGALASGIGIELVAPLERRIDVLIEDYLAAPGAREELRRCLPFLEQRIGPVQWHGRLVALLDAGAERELVRALLELYYDPLYRHSQQGFGCEIAIEASEPARAAELCVAWIEAREVRSSEAAAGAAR